MIVVIFFWLGFSIAVAVAADNRGRSSIGWFFLALLISPLLAGLFLLASSNLKNQPPAGEDATIDTGKACPRCAETVKTAAQVCRFCGHEFLADADAVTM